MYIMNKNERKKSFNEEEATTTKSSKYKGNSGRKESGSKSYKTRDNESFKDDTRKGCIITSARNHNDWRWYVHDETEAKQIASFSYSHAMGNPVDLGSYQFLPSGLAIMEVAPTYGRSNDPASAMNIGVRRNFANMRKANSGSVNYTATTTGFYMLSFDSIYYLMSHIHRAFRVFHHYSTWNRYFPEYILRNLGFVYDDIAENFPQYIARYNNLIRAIAVWNIPNVFPIFERHSYSFGSLFIDNKDPKDQIYALRPSGYYEFEETNSSSPDAQGHRLIWQPLDYHLSKTIKEWLDIVESLLSRIVASSTLQIVNGDMNKAFTDFYKVSLITGEEPVNFIIDDMAREQIMNATILGTPMDLDITETVNSDINEDFYMVVNPRVYNSSFDDDMQQVLLTTYQDNPDAITNLEITRYIVPVDYTSGASAASPRDITGDVADIPVSFTMHTLDATSGSYIMQSISYHTTCVANSADTAFDFLNDNVNHLFGVLSAWMQFDYAPRFLMITGTRQDMDSTFTVSKVFVMSKLANYTNVSKTTLDSVNSIAIQKLFGF